MSNFKKFSNKWPSHPGIKHKRLSDSGLIAWVRSNKVYAVCIVALIWIAMVKDIL